MVPLTTVLASHDLSITWCQHHFQVCQWSEKVMLHFMSIFVDLRNTVVSSMMTLALHYTDAITNGITWPKSHVTLHFSCLYLRNAMVQLRMLLEVYDTDASANGIKLPKCYLVPHLECLNPRNAVVPLTTLLASHGTVASASGATWPKTPVAPHFDHCA